MLCSRPYSSPDALQHPQPRPAPQAPKASRENKAPQATTATTTAIGTEIATTRQMPLHVQQASIFLLTKMAERSAPEISELIRKSADKIIGRFVAG